MMTASMKTATRRAVQQMAYHTAREAKGKRRQDAIDHCRKLGIDPNAKTFEEACRASSAA